MRFQRIIDALYRKPLAITQAGFDTIDAIVRPHIAGQVVKADGGKDFFGNDLPKMELENGVAIIPICGPLIQHADMLDAMCGACSYEWISEQLDAAMEMGVEGIILSFDTPGGQITGCAELAREIADIQQSGTPIYAYCESQMCSAGYYLAAGCTGIFATNSSLVGSIGTIIGFLDVSKAMENQGVKAEYIVSGKLKATAATGTSLSEDQRAYLQSLVDESFASFSGWVRQFRSVPDEAMQGQAMWGSSAGASGLIDGNVNEIEEVVAMINPEYKIGVPVGTES